MRAKPEGRGGEEPLNIDALLVELGFDTPSAKRQARGVLEAVKLTRPGKSGIAAAKRAAIEAALSAALARVCGKECRAIAARSAKRAPVITTGGGCEVCGGSNNKRAALLCARSLRANKVKRAVVVGGTAPLWKELESQLGDAVTWQFIDGTRSHSQKDAIANMNRAQLVVVWGSTPLRHAVSNLYTSEPPPHVRVITVPKRGIEAFCREIVRSYGE